MAGRAAYLNIRTVKGGKTEVGTSIHSKDTIYNLQEIRKKEEFYSSQKKNPIPEVIVKAANEAEPSKQTEQKGWKNALYRLFG